MGDACKIVIKRFGRALPAVFLRLMCRTMREGRRTLPDNRLGTREIAADEIPLFREGELKDMAMSLSRGKSPMINGIMAEL